MSSDSKYRLTLDLWASQHVPAGATVTSVYFAYDDGYEPTFTDRPESLAVHIYYRDKWSRSGAETLSISQLTSVGEMLTALFTIEETNP